MNSTPVDRHYERVMLIVDVLMDCEPAELEARIKEECAGDELLRGEVEELLAEDKPDSIFLEESPLGVFSSMPLEDEPDPFIDKQIGAYVITAEIGRGGMGAVYKATRHDDHYQSEVAIKLIKRGMDSDYILRRFRNERQILANLSHPNIARLLDGGTTADGLPYFVMDYIAGMPINEYCDEKDLSITDRLKLFRSVCKPLQYAHQNLVIHRDLKPTNILVTPDGIPKLLDFGIAKLLTPETGDQLAALTATELRVMTPEYASPEQVKGELATTSTDVYSLGVLLYELITGDRPYRFRNRRPDELFRVICEQQPEKPSTVISRNRSREDVKSGSSGPQSLNPVREGHQGLRARLRGDLDTIVLMALRKEPARRYQSVEQFSEDLRRHLEGLPVLAHKATLAYRSTKFAKRNKLAAGVSVMVLMLLLGGIVTTSWEARVARTERAKAEKRFNDVRHLANSLLFELNDQMELGLTKARELLVRRALEYLDSLAAEGTNDLTLQTELAAAYQKVGDVQSQLHRANVGDSQGALRSYQKALTIREAIAAADPNNAEASFYLALSYNRTGDIFSKTGNTSAALESYRKGLSILERLHKSDPNDVPINRELSANYITMGRALLKLEGSLAALDAFRKAQSMREELALKNLNDPAIQHDLITAYDSVAYVLMESGAMAEALLLNRKSLKMSEELAAANPASIPLRRSLYACLWSLGLTLREAGETAEALQQQKRALAIAHELLQADSTNTQARNDLADVYMEAANTLREARQTSAALEHYRNAIKEYEAVAAADKNNVHVRRQIYYTSTRLGDAQSQAGDAAGALETFRTTLASFQALTTQDPDNTEFRHDLAISYRKLGEMLLRTGESTGALEKLLQALPLIESLASQSPTNAKKRSDLARTYSALALAKVRLAVARESSSEQRKANLREALALLQKSSDIWQAMRTNATLNAADISQPDEVAREIARLDRLTR